MKDLPRYDSVVEFYHHKFAESLKEKPKKSERKLNHNLPSIPFILRQQSKIDLCVRRAPLNMFTLEYHTYKV